MRLFLYALLLVGVTYLILWDASIVRENNAFSENSITEICQELFLVVIVLLFLCHAVTDTANRMFSFTMGCIFLCALIREFDSMLDNHVFDGAWQLVVTILSICVTAIWIRHGENIGKVLASIMHYRSFGIMISGILTVMVFSRFFGQQILWIEIMKEGFQRSVKNAAEEGTELFGYYICLIATLEYWCESFDT